MKEVKIILMHSGTIPSIIIKQKTNYEYSHVVIAMDDKYEELYSFGRKHVYNPFDAGLVKNGIYSDFFKKFNKCKCKIYNMTITDEKYNKLREILKDYESKDDVLKYDILGLVFRYFDIYKKRENHYVCTQFVAEALNKSEIYTFNKSPEKVKPQDFEEIPEMKKIYEGYFLDVNMDSSGEYC